jgi:hypothetical protein
LSDLLQARGVHRASRFGSWVVPCFVGACQLLTPYPGGGDPAQALGDQGSGSGIEGDRQDPLVDPAIDSNVVVSSNADEPVLAIPGTAFLVDLNFTAPERNVVGGGIRFPGSDEVQWTFINALVDDNGSMPIQFGYVVAQDVCEDVPNLCHEIVTEQFAVARNTAPGGDVDGDGSPDGEFVVSRPEPVTVVLMCATCDSKSCQDVLPKGKCQQCVQPQVCRDYYDRCLAEGQPNADTTEADLFETFFGTNGVLWTVEAGCAAGQQACEDAQENAASEPDVCEL